MQLARGFFLTPEKRIKRKIIEIAHHVPTRASLHQEADLRDVRQPDPPWPARKLLDQRIWRSAQAYFGKDVRQLDLAECAMLAGMIQRPNYFNPFRHPDRAIDRRNLVLDTMVETGAITKEQAEQRQG